MQHVLVPVMGMMLVALFLHFVVMVVVVHKMLMLLLLLMPMLVALLLGVMAVVMMCLLRLLFLLLLRVRQRARRKSHLVNSASCEPSLRRRRERSRRSVHPRLSLPRSLWVTATVLGHPFLRCQHRQQHQSPRHCRHCRRYPC